MRPTVVPRGTAAGRQVVSDVTVMESGSEMVRPAKKVLMLLFSLGVLLLPAGLPADAGQHGARFFHCGDGEIDLLSEKNGAVFSGRYRQGARLYEDAAYKAICRVFDAPFDARRRHLSLRLVEFLDYLQDHFNRGARITITSGYRRPEYNKALRQRGALAAKASLHQYGMAADLKIAGVASRRVWNHVKALGFGGAGYYQGEAVHIDVGPARFWDEKTSGVGSGLSDDNQRIGLVSDYDIYAPDDPIMLRFIRMTAFPIGVRPGFVLLQRMPGAGERHVLSFSPAVTHAARSACLRFNTIDQMAAIGWRLPRTLAYGRYQVRATFCNNPWKKMPVQIETPEFQVTGR